MTQMVPLRLAHVPMQLCPRRQAPASRSDRDSGCVPSDPRGRIAAAIGKAPTLLPTDVRGRYAIYAACVRELASAGSGVDAGVAALMRNNLARAEQIHSVEEKARVLRRALDMATVCLAMRAAVAHAAPAAASGRDDSVADIYAAAAEQSLRVGGSHVEPPGLRVALKSAKLAMERHKDKEAALALRHAFDVVLEAWLPPDYLAVEETPRALEVSTPVSPPSRGRRSSARESVSSGAAESPA